MSDYVETPECREVRIALSYTEGEHILLGRIAAHIRDRERTLMYVDNEPRRQHLLYLDSEIERLREIMRRARR